ncbi:MAG TPA: glycerol kinase GlpK [Pyrinomonadaceae bacterium]|nr:glycerol kinase GlpK [Pyrinomonadaceae bacterium]
MSENYILAIDQGTTGTTVLIFDREVNIKGRAYSEITQYYPRPGWVEHDPVEIWQVTMKVVADALIDAGLEARDLRAIGITNQRETTVIWDRMTGQPVANAIVWQDRRTADLCEELKSVGLEDEVRARTGLIIDAYFSGTKIKWFLDHDPALRARATRGELAFGTIDTWLVWNLSGGQCHVTDYSNAARTLLYNIHELRWDQDLLDLLDVPAAILPVVNSSSQIHTYTNAEVFFGQTIPIAGIAGDQQAALFGHACFAEGFVKNTYGTGSFLLMNTGVNAVPSKEGLLTTIAWRVGDGPIEYALEGSIFVTGAAVQWLRDGLKIIKSASDTEPLARSLENNDDVYFVPALVGLGAPYWDPYARGTIVGITRGTTQQHLARAALESICYQTCDVVEAMQRDSAIPITELKADGGAVGNSFLMQFQADMLGVPVEVPKVTETTALGAAYLAGLATGQWTSRAEISGLNRAGKRYVPLMSSAVRNGLKRGWTRAVARAQGWAQEQS